MNLMYITNKADIAKFAADCGVCRIFVDLEVLGKYERQGHLDTVISEHSIDDISEIRSALPNVELLVRINPLHNGTQYEIDRVIAEGADIIMLPMFSSKEDIESVGKMINARARFIPLIETKAAAENIVSYVDSHYVSEFYIGLNDLHRDLGYKFMFELLSSGYVESLIDFIKRAGKPFGFGGIACIGEGTLPASLVLAEHARLGSSSVILSRAFHHRSNTLSELKSKIDLNKEISKLYDELTVLKSRNVKQTERDKQSFAEIVQKIVIGIK